MNLLIDFCFLSAVPLLSRGWIVPVGGSTPDRLKDRRKIDQRKAGAGQVRNCRLHLRICCSTLLSGKMSPSRAVPSRSGVEPPTGKLRPR